MPAAASPPEPRTYRLPAVEIFASGTFDGRDYPDSYLDRVVQNFDALRSGGGVRAFSLDPPAVHLPVPDVGIGHDDDQGYLRTLLQRTDLPAAGWPVRVWRDGHKLFADLESIPEEVAELVNGRRLRKVSAEFYDDFMHPSPDPGEEVVPRDPSEYPFADERGRTHYGPTLRRISLLGGELPKNKLIGDLPRATFAETRDHQQLTLYFAEVRPMDRDAAIAALQSAGIDVSKVPPEVLEQFLAAVAGTAATPAMPAEAPAVGPDTSMHAESATEITSPPSEVDPGNPSSAPGVKNPPTIVPDQNGINKNSEAARVRQLEAQVRQLSAAVAPVLAQRTQARRERLQLFCEQMATEGRLYPYEMSPKDAQGRPQPTLLDRLLALPDSGGVLKFGEKSVSPLEAEMEAVRRRPVLRRFGESMAAGPAGNAGKGVNGTGMSEAEWAAERRRIHALTPVGRGLLDREKKRDSARN